MEKERKFVFDYNNKRFNELLYESAKRALSVDFTALNQFLDSFPVKEDMKDTEFTWDLQKYKK